MVSFYGRKHRIDGRTAGSGGAKAPPKQAIGRNLPYNASPVGQRHLPYLLKNLTLKTDAPANAHLTEVRETGRGGHERRARGADAHSVPSALSNRAARPLCPATVAVAAPIDMRTAMAASSSASICSRS